MDSFVAQEKISRVEATMRSQSRNWWDWNLWLQWALANLVGEVLGLGLAGAVAIAMVLTVGEPETPLVAVMMAGVMIAAGALEGVIVGFAQWLVLRRRLRRLSRREWVTATAIGALVAWAVGMAPSTLSALRIALTIVVTIAAAGAAVGAIHGVALLWLLRQRQEKAGPVIEDA